MLNPTQNLFSFLKDAWTHGKKVPVLNQLLDLVEGVIQKTTGTDFLMNETQLHLKNIDEIMKPAIGRSCQFVQTVIDQVQSIAESLMKNSFPTQGDAKTCSNSSTHTNLEEEQKQPLVLNEEIPGSPRDSPNTKTNIPHKKTDNNKHRARFSLLSPKRGSKIRRKLKKRSSSFKDYQVETESRATNIVSPAKSELGETKLIKEAIKYFSSGDFVDNGNQSAVI